MINTRLRWKCVTLFLLLGAVIATITAMPSSIAQIKPTTQDNPQVFASVNHISKKSPYLLINGSIDIPLFSDLLALNLTLDYSGVEFVGPVKITTAMGGLVGEKTEIFRLVQTLKVNQNQLIGKVLWSDKLPGPAKFRDFRIEGKIKNVSDKGFQIQSTSRFETKKNGIDVISTFSQTEDSLSIPLATLKTNFTNFHRVDDKSAPTAKIEFELMDMAEIAGEIRDKGTFFYDEMNNSAPILVDHAVAPKCTVNDQEVAVELLEGMLAFPLEAFQGQKSAKVVCDDKTVQMAFFTVPSGAQVLSTDSLFTFFVETTSGDYLADTLSEGRYNQKSSNNKTIVIVVAIALVLTLIIGTLLGLKVTQKACFKSKNDEDQTISYENVNSPYSAL